MSAVRREKKEGQRSIWIWGLLGRETVLGTQRNQQTSGSKETPTIHKCHLISPRLVHCKSEKYILYPDPPPQYRSIDLKKIYVHLLVLAASDHLTHLWYRKSKKGSGQYAITHPRPWICWGSWGLYGEDTLAQFAFFYTCHLPAKVQAGVGIRQSQLVRKGTQVHSIGPWFEDLGGSFGTPDPSLTPDPRPPLRVVSDFWEVLGLWRSLWHCRWENKKSLFPGPSFPKILEHNRIIH